MPPADAASPGRVLALIPARGGSKGIPGKNLKPVAGRPLIAWTIGHARAATLVDRVVVSTDDDAIAAAARDAGAEVPFMRPTELAQDTTPTEPVLLHALEVLAAGGYRPDLVVLLQPTCPIRHPGSVDGAIRRLADDGADSVLSVVPIAPPFVWFDRTDPACPERGVTATYDIDHRPRRQDIARADLPLRETGSIYVTRRSLLVGRGNRLGGRIALYEMSDTEGIDIDTPFDLMLADLVIRQETGGLGGPRPPE